MEIYVFILLALVWAAFLLPSFWDSRRSAPLSTTRSFARSTALLASVAAVPVQEVMLRHRAMQRRRRALVVMAVGAVISLALAIWQNSLVFLGFTLLFDLALAGYVTLLLHLKQQRTSAGAVVPMPVAVPTDVPQDSQPTSVRVVAG